MTDTTQPSADVERLRAALTGLLTHSHITDSDPADWELEDHAVESEARAALAAVPPRPRAALMTPPLPGAAMSAAS